MTNPTSTSPPVASLGRGDLFPRRVLTDRHGAPVPVPDPDGRLVHLQLRRFAGCPVCSLHLLSFAARHDAIVAAGVREVAVFHSTADELVQAQLTIPFAVIPDPDKHLYAELGVGTSVRALLDPRAWGAATRGLLTGASANPALGQGGGSFGLPGDFLIAPDGRIVDARIGAHADDQWSVDDLLVRVAAVGR
ncbi:MAG: AhpC/TSA family protein [Alphaproteobacteria bacterium]|nr:AhpC/TSA family protein [Alphaproteobacteria bacterium]